VRAAARYFLHVGDHEQAHDVLKRSPILGKDPWVQASEIAVATVRGRTSALAKQAIRKLASLDAIGVDRSELATALGTIEMLDGSDKKAKQLFQKALRSPTDNSLAQVEWAATRLNLVVDEAALQTPFSFEANSNNAYRKLMIPDAIEFAKEWSSDEPFASRPLVALTYYYSLEERFEDAVRAADTAIAADGGNDIVMRLNRLFAIIQQGELDGVQQELGRIAVHPQAREHATQVLANAGALAYAAEEIELGRSYYEKAIKSARAKGDAAEEALARANFARTAVRHRDPNAARIVQETSVAVKLLPSPGALHIVRKLVDQVERAKIEAAAAKRVAKRKLEWDATTNTLRLLE
jgi:tetratricopeptide (TPR) repeat protein